MSDIRKRKKGQILNNNERQLILNLISYLKEKNSGKSISEVIREISKATGCSERTIYKIRKEASKGITVIVNRTRERKKENKNSRNVKYDSFVKSSIRKKVYNFFIQGIPPSLNAILNLVNNDPSLPDFKRSTLHTFLKEIGFTYEQKGKKSLLVEKPEVIRTRRKYLEDIARFRSENRWVIYTGETLISLTKKDLKKEEEDVAQPLVPITCQTYNAVFVTPPDIIAGTALVYTIESTGLVNAKDVPNVNLVTVQNVVDNDSIAVHTMIAPQNVVTAECSQAHLESEKEVVNKSEDKTKNRLEKELRFRVMHATTDKGFVEGADMVTLCKKKADDVESYVNWFVNKLLPKIPQDSVVVADDNAPYLKKKEDNIPDGSWKKQQIKNWLTSKNVDFGDVNQKKELIAIVNDVKPVHSTKCKIRDAARQRGVTVLYLPSYHYELNPLNVVWPGVKSHVKSHLRSFKIQKIKELIKEGFSLTTQDNWLNYLEGLKETESLLSAVDELRGNGGSESKMDT